MEQVLTHTSGCPANPFFRFQIQTTATVNTKLVYRVLYYCGHCYRAVVCVPEDTVINSED